MTQAPSWIDTKISAGGPNQTQKSTTLLTRVRGGIGWHPLADTGIYTDVEYLRIYNEDESANFARVMFMSEKFVTPRVPLRFGITVDTAGQATSTVGAGLYDLKGLNIDLYYSYNAYPEIRRELGKTSYWMFVVSRIF